MTPFRLTDPQWEQVLPLIPPPPATRGGHGLWIPDRSVLDALLWVIVNQAGWHSLPRAIYPAAGTAYARVARWRAAGVLGTILAAVGSQLPEDDQLVFLFACTSFEAKRVGGGRNWAGSFSAPPGRPSAIVPQQAHVPEPVVGLDIAALVGMAPDAQCEHLRPDLRRLAPLAYGQLMDVPLALVARAAGISQQLAQRVMASTVDLTHSQAAARLRLMPFYDALKAQLTNLWETPGTPLPEADGHLLVQLMDQMEQPKSLGGCGLIAAWLVANCGQEHLRAGQTDVIRALNARFGRTRNGAEWCARLAGTRSTCQKASRLSAFVRLPAVHSDGPRFFSKGCGQPLVAVAIAPHILGRPAWAPQDYVEPLAVEHARVARKSLQLEIWDARVQKTGRLCRAHQLALGLAQRKGHADMDPGIYTAVMFGQRYHPPAGVT